MATYVHQSVEAVSYTHLVGEGAAELARLLGEYIGICFQIKDDIFDYFDLSLIHIFSVIR